MLKLFKAIGKNFLWKWYIWKRDIEVNKRALRGVEGSISGRVLPSIGVKNHSPLYFSFT